VTDLTIAERIDSIDEYLVGIIKNDKTDYSYGGQRAIRPSDGSAPAKGQRWNTPAEMARDARKELADLKAMVVVAMSNQSAATCTRHGGG
jgi:hypothetical protein